MIRHDEVSTLFRRCVELHADARDAVLERHADTELRREVRELLRFHETLSGPDLSADALASWLASPRREVAVGGRIGSYVVTGVLGRGGAGVVYAARQTGAIERDVALKVLDLPGPLAEAGRFAAERNAMAMLRHPHVAQVYDAGALPDGTAYLAMERVDGVPADVWAERHRPTRAQVLRVVRQAADALAHAHARGVIHRDVKPSNLLVEGGSGDAHVQLIDFGLVSPAAGSALSRFAADDRPVAGTPAYMAPEQARPDTPADVRQDVYGLAAVAFVLLCGRPPLDVSDLADASVVEVFEAVATRPRVRANDVAPRLPRDLAAVLDKALSHDGHVNVADFASDLDNYAAGRPVSARAASWGYVARRFVGRHAVPLAAAGVAAALLAGGLAGTTAGFLRASHDNRQYRSQLAANAAVNAFLIDDLLLSATPGQDGRELRVVDVLERGAGKIDARFPDEPLTRASLHLAIGEVLMSLGQYDVARRELSSGLEHLLPPAHPQRLRATAAVAQMDAAQGRDDEANAGAELVLRLSRGMIDPTAVNAAARAHMALADVTSRRQDHAAALAHAEAAVALLENLHATGGNAGERLVEAYNLRMLALDALGDPRVADAMNELPGHVVRLLGEDHVYAAGVRANEAAIMLDAGRYDDALPLLRGAAAVYARDFGPAHPQTLILLGNLVTAESHAGDFAAAVTEARRLITLGDSSPVGAFERTNFRHRLAAVLLRGDDPAAAVVAASDAYAYAGETLGQYHWLSGQCRATLGYARAAAGDTAGARDDWVAARGVMAISIGKDNPRVKALDDRLVATQSAGESPGVTTATAAQPGRPGSGG